MTDAQRRDCIVRALNDPFARIPQDLMAAFDAYQFQHYRHFLFKVNLLAQLAYFSYGVADFLLLPDIGWISPLLRTLLAALTLPVVFLVFHRSRNVKVMDILLPILVLVASVLWYEILAHSTSPFIPTYFYASLIFIVLANLAVQVRFLPAMYVSLVIASYTIWNAYRLNHGDWTACGVFVLIFLPVVLFSLFNSWSTTFDRRTLFLRAELDEMTRQDLKRANEQLEVLAHTDSLTGVSNRRHFEKRWHLEAERARRHGTALCLMILDIDFFKRINDTHGHAAGDRVLRSLCQHAGSALRENDLLARCGGEEFHILLPDTHLAGAVTVAERLRQALADCPVVIENGKKLHFTVSIGIAQLDPAEPSLDATHRRADEALYQAKASGRNKVCCS